jgi:hypothetical protein
MSFCANNKSIKNTGSARDRTTEMIQPIESERIIADKNNSFNYNLKKCRTFKERDYEKYKQLMQGKMKPLNSICNERGESTMADYNNHQIVKEQDIILEDQKEPTK